jgi:hypothetical protein
MSGRQLPISTGRSTAIVSGVSPCFSAAR